MATMNDVAQLAGVSIATVSRTLINPDKVASSTKSRVEAAIIKLGYRSSTLTRTMHRSESKIIIILIPDICDPYFTEIIRGIETTAAEHGYLTIFSDGNLQQKRENSYVNFIFTKQVDGILILSSDLSFNVSKAEQRNLPPIVMACEYDPELELPAVHIDNLTAAFEIVNYLTKMGHRKIAQIAGPKESASYQFRHQGYLQALQRADIKLNTSYCVHSDLTFEGGARSLRKLLILSENPTAIFCHNDTMAIGVIQEAKSLGLRIPQDLSVVGFDNIQSSLYCDPPLTTVSQPRYEIGQQAMLILLEQLKGKHIRAGSRLLETKLMIRGSVALPRIRYSNR